MRSDLILAPGPNWGAELPASVLVGNTLHIIDAVKRFSHAGLYWLLWSTRVSFSPRGTQKSKTSHPFITATQPRDFLFNTHVKSGAYQTELYSILHFFLNVLIQCVFFFCLNICFFFPMRLNVKKVPLTAYFFFSFFNWIKLFIKHFLWFIESKLLFFFLKSRFIWTQFVSKEIELDWTDSPDDVTAPSEDFSSPTAALWWAHFLFIEPLAAHTVRLCPAST